MFVDELTIYAKAGDGGDGVVRWRHLKFKPMAGPAGGNGGRGGDVYLRAVADLNILSKYTGDKKFIAEDGEPGRASSQFGKAGADVYIDVPVGSRVTDKRNERTIEMLQIGQTLKILKGGAGGYGNEQFKSSTNTSPEESTQGRSGEEGHFFIELAMLADVGLVGLPNSGKSSLLNALTNAKSQVGAYPFTTLAPHLGNMYGHLVADIPGLIEGAHAGKGLGQKFLRHISRTKMLLHVVSLDSEDPKSDFLTVKNELANFDKALLDKESWIVLTKKDLVDQAVIDAVVKSLDEHKNRVFILSLLTGDGVKDLQDSLVKHLQRG